MPIIIDGNNVLGRMNWEEADLVRSLRNLSVTKKLRILLCFDGDREHGQRTTGMGKFKVLYSGPFRSADDVIEQEAARVPNRQDWILYSDDRDLCQKVRLHGVKSSPVGELASQLRTINAVQRKSGFTKPHFEPDKENLLKAMIDSGND